MGLIEGNMDGGGVLVVVGIIVRVGKIEGR